MRTEASKRITTDENHVNVGADDLGVERFEPHPWLRGGHAQTIVGSIWGGEWFRMNATEREVELSDGDRLLVLESVPPGWTKRRPTALMVHGLAGSADVAYVVRIARRLYRLGVRVVRINLRNAGRGFGLARYTYHAGRSDDLRAVAHWLDNRHTGSPIALVGFSLGANLVLKLASEAADVPVPRLDCVVAANPPIDLAVCSRLMSRPENRVYDRHFVRELSKMVRRLHRRFPDLGPPALGGAKTLYDFDDRYTAKRNGFGSADEYYRRCSLSQSLVKIPIPGLIVHASDDPFVAAEPLLKAEKPAHLAVELTSHGGHLGYLSRDPWQGNRRWLDTRLVTWLQSRWNGMIE